jgi:hypothetical protein
MEKLAALVRAIPVKPFCRYDKINHDFNVLESIFRIQRSDWKAALDNLKGVYLISDKSNGKLCVGSAYGGHAHEA